jgi:uncharacterized oxidoreductase
MPTLATDELESLVCRIFVAAGTPPRSAEVVAASLVLSNLKGVDSHGIMRVPLYLGHIETGRIVVDAEPVVERKGAVVTVAGGWCFGQLAAGEAARQVAVACREAGVAVATVSQVHHVGRLGEYVELAAREGVIALAFCNTGPPGGWVAPFGGRKAMLATNPLAYAVPAKTHPPIAADFSTSAVAVGRVWLAQENGLEIPEGWLIDVEGRSTRDPGALDAGGALLPAGGHRGYALALLVELLGGALAGAGCGLLGHDPGNGLVLVALDPGAWRDRAGFLAEVDAVAETIARAEPADGVDRVRLPGEPEAEIEAIRRAEGIPIPDGTWRGLTEAAEQLGVS